MSSVTGLMWLCRATAELAEKTAQSAARRVGSLLELALSPIHDISQR
jgi:hypothetical protein